MQTLIPNPVFIPPGTFRMGSPTNEVARYADEGPQTAVTISRGFWMGKYEVTQGEYEALIGNNPSLCNGFRPNFPYPGTNTDFGTDLMRPVERVTGKKPAHVVGRISRSRTNGSSRLPKSGARNLVPLASASAGLLGWSRDFILPVLRFSIVTPSFRNSAWLRLCIASVADQEIEREHIVQDSCSDDGTQEWLPQDKRVAAFIEKDKGMYDAVNRGFRRAKGELLAYLNCDEEYLPGALGKVSEYFEQHPEVDVVFGDTVVVNAQGEYLCDRRALIPQRLHTFVSYNLSFLTAGMFLRRRVLDQHGLFFDPGLRDVGDGDWTARAIDAGLGMATLGGFTSTFSETGNNMNLGANAAREKRELFQRAPVWVQKAAPIVVAHFRLRRLFAGHYRCRPYEYAIYTHESPQKRKVFRAQKPTFRWRR